MHFLTSAALLSAFALSTSAHFVLQYPNSLGFDDDNEPNAPCGGFDVVFGSNDSSVGVDSFPVSMRSTHPAADFLFRATLDKQAPFNWTNLLPVVSETGLGQFCLPALKAPSSFAGKPGVIQVIQNGPDGILYQCAAVNFVTAVSGSSQCTNVTGLTATITNQNSFDTSASASASTASSTAAATSSGSAPSSSSTSNAAAMSAPQAVTGLFGVMALVASYVL